MTFDYSIRNGFVSEVGISSPRIQGTSQVVLGMTGVETADWTSFYSTMGEGFGFKEQQVAQTSEDGRTVLYKADVEMRHGHWQLRHETVLEPQELIRFQRLTCRTSSTFQDFVMRFVAPKRSFDVARIAGHAVHHRETNRWYQFETNRVQLEGPHGVLAFDLIDWSGADAFRQVAYVRDEPGAWWIVHFRLIPSIGPTWVKWDSRYGRLVDIRGRPADALVAARWLRDRLWYRAERVGGRPNLQAIRLAVLDAGAELRLGVRTTFAPPPR